MKHPFILLAAALLVTSSGAPPPDFTGINRATTNLLAVVDTLQKELPVIEDSKKTAEAVNSFATALDEFTTAMISFGERFPEATKGSEPPKEIAAAFGALSQLKTKYSSVPKLLGARARIFRDSPDVANAMAKLRVAIERADNFPKR